MAVFVVTVDMSRAAIENESVSTTFRRAVLSSRGSQVNRESNETGARTDTGKNSNGDDGLTADAMIGIENGVEVGVGVEADRQSNFGTGR